MYSPHRDRPQHSRKHHANDTSERISYKDGVMNPPRTDQIISAWDMMTLQKLDPGSDNVPYVAGMNVTQCPTMTFSIANKIATSDRYQGG